MFSTSQFCIQQSGKYFLTTKVPLYVPLYENQQRYWDEIETLESVWHMKMSPDSPDSRTQKATFTPTIDSPVDNLDTPKSEDHRSPSLFDTPTVEFCYAPKNENWNEKLTF